MKPIYEVIDTSFFVETEKIPPEFSDQCKKYPTEPQFLPSEVKVTLKKWLQNKCYMQNW